MELTAEEKQRIEEEERKRLSEEQYRAEVRAKLHIGNVAGNSALVEKKSAVPWLIGFALVLVVATLVWASVSGSKPRPKSESASAPPIPAKATPVLRTRYVPVDQKIATGQIVVRAQGYVQYRLTIGPEMVQPTVTGSFNASGGGGNDITAVIADEANFINWINGHQARVYWNTQGRETTGNFEVRLPPGTYYLAFNNKFSLFTEKQVFIEADLNYKKAETYYDDQVGQPFACPVPPCTGVAPNRVNYSSAPLE